MVAVGGVEFDAADVGPGVLGPPFGLQRRHALVHVNRPKLDLGVVTTRRQQLGVLVVEVDAPAPLLVLLELFDSLVAGMVTIQILWSVLGPNEVCCLTHHLHSSSLLIVNS